MLMICRRRKRTRIRLSDEVAQNVCALQHCSSRLIRNMGVYLGRGDARMPKQSLNNSNVDAALNKQRHRGVPCKLCSSHGYGLAAVSDDGTNAFFTRSRRQDRLLRRPEAMIFATLTICHRRRARHLDAGVTRRSQGANALRPVDGQERKGRGLIFPKLSLDQVRSSLGNGHLMNAPTCPFGAKPGHDEAVRLSRE
jgi:hypothetical protein